MTHKTKAAFTLSDMLAATGGQVLGPVGSGEVCGVSTDSRHIEAGNLFVALTGDRFDGHDFLAQALERGAAALMIHKDAVGRLPKPSHSVLMIGVADTLVALGDLAHFHRMRFPINVIGLTGSSGKTTTREMIASILSRQQDILVTQGNFNNLIGLPLTLLGLDRSHVGAVLEMGTNQPGEIGRLTQIASPDVGLITNVGPAHLEGFGSLDAVRDEKGDLFMKMRPDGCAVINIDDESVKTIALGWAGRRITFGMSDDADVIIREIEKRGARGMRFRLCLGKDEQTLEMKIAGLHHVYNATAAAATAWAWGAGPEAIRAGLEAFVPVSGRMEIVALQNGAYLVDDAYNANPASVREALLALKDLKGTHQAFVFLGDMLELGDAAEEMHRRIGTMVGTIGVTALFLKGQFARTTAAGAEDSGMDPKQIHVMADEGDAMGGLEGRLGRGDWVLVKGSRGMRMDRITNEIRERFGGGLAAAH